jgi:hypothetical protein
VSLTSFSMGVKKSISPMTRQQKRKNKEVPSKVRVWKIVPEVPRDEAERAELLEDLQTMDPDQETVGFLTPKITK